MDITKSKKDVFTNKVFNGETVNYGFCFLACSFLFLVLKQLLKGFVSAAVSVGISACVTAVVLFLLENRFVFFHGRNKSLLKKSALFVFRCAVDFGFYRIASFAFNDTLHTGDGFVFLMTGLIYFFFNYYFDRLLVFDCIKSACRFRNGRAYRLFFDNRFVLASALLAVISIGFIYGIFKLFPFGDMTVLRMDLYHQYGPLFVELYDRVTQFKSFLYSWTSGGGSSFLGNYFNYLSSPLSAIILLFDRKDMPYAITTMVAVKGVFSAVTFTYYLKKSLRRHSYASAAFGVFYAFCGYFLAYYWNIMWIDGMIMLPLITLGIERIINKRKPALYIGSLTVMLYASYYIGYMLCLFSVLYFIAYYLMTGGLGDKIDETLTVSKRYSLKKAMNLKAVRSGFLFAGASLFSGLLCACTLVPVFFILQSCSATSDSFPSGFNSYFDLLNLITSHLAGLETTIRSSGEDVLPNIYCGMLSVLLLPLYIANSKIRLREKGIYVLLLIVFVFSFDNNYANFIWHALHFPNDLPYRFSFIYSFIVLVMAFRGLMKIRHIQYRDIAFTGMLWILVILLLQKFQTNKMGELCIYISIAFVIIWTAVLLLLKKGTLPRFVAGIAVVAIAFCEVIVADSNSYLFTQHAANYTSNYANYRQAVKYIEGHDDGVYRSELTYLDTRMDPCLYGYSGMSTFSSMAYENYSQNQYSLGMFGNRINSYTYNTQTPVYNAMYALKYLIKTESTAELSTDYYQKLFDTADFNNAVYENRYFLPIAFEVASEAETWVNEEGNPFDVQADFMQKATGTDGLFVPVKYGETACDEIECEDVTENGTYYFSKVDPESTYGNVDITVKGRQDGNIFVYIASPETENVNYYWNNDEESKYQNINEPYIYDLGYHKKGEEIRISLECGSIDEDSSYFDIYAYTLDKDTFESAYELLNLGALKVTRHSETCIEGTLSAGYDGMLYTSIPFDKGWSIYIDGEKASTRSLGDCQLVCGLKSGEHTVRLQYTPRGLKLGAAVSAASWLGILGYAVFRRVRKKKKAAVLSETE